LLIPVFVFSQNNGGEINLNFEVLNLFLRLFLNHFYAAIMPVYQSD